MLHAGVVGNPIAHSLSPELHRAAYEFLGIQGKYEKYFVPKGDLISFLTTHPELNGLSVTMPLKPEAFALATDHDTYSELTQISNTLVFEDSLKAYNTDIYGIQQALMPKGEGYPTAALLGGGATACSALCALHELGVQEVNIYLRDLTKTRELQRISNKLDITTGYRPLGTLVKELLVLTTLPGGAVTNYLKSIVPDKTEVIFDVNYAEDSPLETFAIDNSVHYISGLEMLLNQASKQVELFTHKSFDHSELVAVMRQSVRK